MPTPSSRIASDCSKISQSIPRACSISPVTRPPTPPPAMITFMTLLLAHAVSLLHRQAERSGGGGPRVSAVEGACGAEASREADAPSTTPLAQRGPPSPLRGAGKKCSLPQVAENATICGRHGYDGVPSAVALSARLSILPTPVRGSASRKAMCFGNLYLTRFCLQ